MTFADKRNSAYGGMFGPDFILPSLEPEIIKRGLEAQQRLQSIEPEVTLAEHLGDHITPDNPDVRLVGSRLLSQLTLKLSMTDFADKEPNQFASQSHESQVEIIHEALADYGHTMAARLDALNADVSLMPKLRQLDPLQAIPHQMVIKHIHDYKRNAQSIGERLQSVASYLNVIPGTYPPKKYRDTSAGVHDSLLIQAFGRNDITDKELPEIVEMHRRYADRVVFGILLGEKFDAGESNRALADEMMKTLQGPQVIEPIVQWEVAFAVYQKDPAFYMKHENYIHVVWPSSDFYPTFQVKADSIAVMNEVGLYNPLELAHQDMTVRAMGILARQGIIADPYHADIPYDAQSVQMQVRSKKNWVVRETLTRAEHIVRNRVRF